KGIRVAVDPAVPCGKCEQCLNGRPNICPHVIFAGHGEQDGALREWVAWDSSCLFELPETISDAEGAMLEPLGVAIHAIDLAKLQIGITVGVFGCGPIGLLIIQLARLAGAKQIIATDPLPHRVDAAKKAGADQAVLVSPTTDLPGLLALTNGRGVDVAFDVSGAPHAVDAAFQLAVPGGRVMLVGIPEDDRTTFCAALARRKELSVKLVRRMKHTYPRAIDLVNRKQVDIASIVTHHFPLEQSNQAFQLASHREGLKTIIEL
ncbi:MAG TPA: zinc-binding dehydrogenase, partial [Leptolinea sp.]